MMDKKNVQVVEIKSVFHLRGSNITPQELCELLEEAVEKKGLCVTDTEVVKVSTVKEDEVC